jgi:hypothetical protein
MTAQSKKYTPSTPGLHGNPGAFSYSPGSTLPEKVTKLPTAGQGKGHSSKRCKFFEKAGDCPEYPKLLTEKYVGQQLVFLVGAHFCKA